MSDVQKQPKVPDSMTYRDEERELARQKQQEAADKLRKSKKERIVAAIAGSALVVTGGVIAAFKYGEANAAPEKTPEAGAPVIPGEEAPTALIDIRVNDADSIENYTLTDFENNEIVLYAQDEAINTILAKVADEASYDYSEDLSYIAEGEALDQYKSVIDTAHERFLEIKQELSEKGASQEEIANLVPYIQSLSEGDPVITPSGYIQNAKVNYIVVDKAVGSSSLMYENDFMYTYEYTKRIVGTSDGSITQDVLRVSGATPES